MSLRHLAPFQHVKWDPNQQELRSFARSMLIGFAVLALLAVARHRGITPLALGLCGAGVLLCLGALIPRVGRWVYLGVYVPTSLVGFVVSSVLLTVVFYLVFTPIGLVLRGLGKDPLRLRHDPSRTQWQAHPQGEDRRRYYRTY